MAPNATEAMLVTFRVSNEKLASTLSRLWDELDIVSATAESDADAIDAKQIASSVVRQIDELIADPPYTEFQCGYLEALVTLYREGLGLNRGQTDGRIDAAERLISDRFRR